MKKYKSYQYYIYKITTSKYKLYFYIYLLQNIYCATRLSLFVFDF